MLTDRKTKMPMIRQEMFCHGCDGYVQFELEIDVDGEYQIDCPNCGHQHFRYVRNGRITDQRAWGGSSGTSGSQYTQVTWQTYSVISMDGGNSTGGNYYWGADGTATTGAF
jgi:hypothetical protein